MVHVPVGAIRRGALDSEDFFAQVAFTRDFLGWMNLKRECLVRCNDLHEEGQVGSEGVEDARAKGFFRVLCDEVAQSSPIVDECWTIWVITEPKFRNRPGTGGFTQEFSDCAL